MWQAPSQRPRAMQVARKRERDKLRRTVHVIRSSANIRIIPRKETNANGKPTVVLEARIILNDISPKGVGLFTSTMLQAGQEVAILIEEPMRVYLRGKVVWCQEQNMDTRILSQGETFTHRIGVKFIFESKTEEDAVMSFYENLGRDHLHTVRED